MSLIYETLPASQLQKFEDAVKDALRVLQKDALNDPEVLNRVGAVAARVISAASNKDNAAQTLQVFCDTLILNVTEYFNGTQKHVVGVSFGQR